MFEIYVKIFKKKEIAIFFRSLIEFHPNFIHKKTGIERIEVKFLFLTFII